MALFPPSSCQKGLQGSRKRTPNNKHHTLIAEPGPSRVRAGSEPRPSRVRAGSEPGPSQVQRIKKSTFEVTPWTQQECDTLRGTVAVLSQVAPEER